MGTPPIQKYLPAFDYFFFDSFHGEKGKKSDDNHNLIPLHFIRGHFLIFLFDFFYRLIYIHTTKNFDVKPINFIVDKFMYSFHLISTIRKRWMFFSLSIKLFLFRQNLLKEIKIDVFCINISIVESFMHSQETIKKCISVIFCVNKCNKTVLNYEMRGKTSVWILTG